MVNYADILNSNHSVSFVSEPKMGYGSRNYGENVIVRMTFQFALGIIELSEELREQKRFAFADQILRAGCSIGANVREAQSAESKADFIHKMKIAIKEAEETEFWLDLCNYSAKYPKPAKLTEEIVTIIKVLNKIISTAKRRSN